MDIKSVNTLTTLLCISVLLIGCSNVEDEFIVKLNEDDNREFCLSFSDTNYILEMERLKMPNGDIVFTNENRVVQDERGQWTRMNLGGAMLLKLAEKGYVEEKPTRIDYTFSRDNGYKLTDKGLKYFPWEKDTCFGNRTATSIIEYTEPAEDDGVTITNVKFAYDVKLNDLTNDLGLENTLREEKDIGDEGEALFIKTNKGWNLKWGW